MGPFLYVLLSVVALLLFFTVGRAIYCWYTKVNVVVERLDDIILKLNNISGSLSTTKSAESAEAAPAVIEVNKEVVEAKPAPVKNSKTRIILPTQAKTHFLQPMTSTFLKDFLMRKLKTEIWSTAKCSMKYGR